MTLYEYPGTSISYKCLFTTLGPLQGILNLSWLYFKKFTIQKKSWLFFLNYFKNPLSEFLRLSKTFYEFSGSFLINESLSMVLGPLQGILDLSWLFFKKLTIQKKSWQFFEWLSKAFKDFSWIFWFFYESAVTSMSHRHSQGILDLSWLFIKKLTFWNRKIC